MIVLEYIKKQNQKCAVVKIKKEQLNGIDAMEFIDIINEIDDDAKEVIIDIANVAYISSPGIGMILKANIALEKRDQKMTIVNCSPSIKQLLAMTKLDTIININ
jgi:anti-anti-sigma factor